MGLLKDLIIKLGLDSSGVDKGVNQANNSLGGLKNMVGKVGAAMGIAFGVSEIISFGKEIIGLASKTEGVKRAFDRLGMPSLMNDLKAATRGAVSEFDLMKSAVSANNFKIPLENLSSYLSFATRRAEETGQSVDYLVDSIIMGIGRKSPMILDNLGISILDIRNEMEKTGDMAKAVANIINSEMANAGTAADTAATKFGQLSAKWEDFKTALGGGLSEGSKSPVSWLTSALETMTNYIKSETIPTWRKWLGLVNITMLGANIQDANREAEQKKLAEINAKKLAPTIDTQDVTYEKALSEIARMQKVILDPKQYTAANLAYLQAMQMRKSEFDKVYAAEIEAKEKILEDEKAIKKAIEESVLSKKKKAALDSIERKNAEKNISLNKSTEEDYEKLIKLNEELIKKAKNDEERRSIIVKNSALKTQLDLINRIAERQSFVQPTLKTNKVGALTKEQLAGRGTLDISNINTDALRNITELSSAVDEYEKQAKRVDDISRQIAGTIQNTAINAFSQLGQAIGGMGDMNAGQAVAALLNPFADLAIELGVIILMSSKAITALMAALSNPFTAPAGIAIGAALIAVGVAAKAGLAALASSGGKSQRQASVSGGSFLGAKDYESRSEMVTVQVEGKLKGSDIYISNQKEATRRRNGF